MKKLLITTLVDSRYRDYAELFAWSCRKSYPEYDVKVFDKDALFRGYPDRGYTTNALRMVMPPMLFSGYGYVYITDIDIMILRESPTLLDVHLKDLTGCFANSIRCASNVFSCNGKIWDGTQCLSGLHFATPEWFERAEPIAREYREMLKTAEVGRGYDGRMLYLICKELGLPIPPKRKLIARHHGIHIGTLRLWSEGKPYINRPGAAPMTKEKADESRQKRIQPWKIARWKEYMADPEYAKIVGRIKNPIVKGYVMELEKYARLH